MSWFKELQYNTWLFWNRLDLKRFGKSILSVFGSLWLVVEILVFFRQRDWAENIKSIWWVFLIVGLVIIIYRNWPKSLFTFKVHNRDVSVSVKIGDIFKLEGALIIPINNHLDCDNNGVIKKSSSILRYFIDNVYNNVSAHLNTDIQQELEENAGWYNQFIEGESPITYKVGTVVPIFRSEKQYYMLCSAILNEKGRSKTTLDNLRISLNGLWAFLTHSGSKDNLIIPIVGTGRGRIPLKRDSVIKEIVLSFLVSLSQDSYCDQLTICIHPNDLKENNMNLDDLLDFIKLQCKNTGYLKGNENPMGTAIE